MLIAFRGTQTWRELLNNFNTWPRATSYGRIHSGYLNTVRTIDPILFPCIRADIEFGRKIVLAGHSRGGSIALLYALMLGARGYCTHSIWTFGSPMVGDKRFGDALRQLPRSSSVQASQKRPKLIDGLKAFRNVVNMEAGQYDWVTDFPPRIPRQPILNRLTRHRPFYLIISFLLTIKLAFYRNGQLFP